MSESPFPLPESVSKNMKILAAVLAVAILIPMYGIWKWFFCRIEVPEGQFAVLVAKMGDDLPDGRILALDPSEKGIQYAVLPEGRHFRNPLIWDWEIHALTFVPAGNVGVQTRLYGEIPDDAAMRAGHILVSRGDETDPSKHERGIVREILDPGRAYRINPYAYLVEIEKAQEIHPGYVGVVTRLDGKNATKPNDYLVKKGEKGVQPEPLQPGTHYLNPREKLVSPVSVQSQRFELTGEKALIFPSQDGFDMRVLLTVEWSIDPERAAEVYVRIGVGDPSSLLDEIRRKTIVPAVRGYGRVEGSKFPAIDYISGETRLAFQHMLFDKLKSNIATKGIRIHSVLVNDILPPQELAQPIREREVAKEELTKYNAQRDQAVEDQKLAREEELIAFEGAKVKAETEKLKKEIAANNRREIALRQQEATLIEAERALEEAKLQAGAILARGRAEADVVVYDGEAEGRTLEAAVEAFGDADTYARYVFARRTAPAIESVLAGMNSPFARLFDDILRARAIAESAPVERAATPADESDRLPEAPASAPAGGAGR